ncbi:type II toxin-antitoxin system RelE/ParE family toxin [Kribbella monticola]|uniref:type II toxin-antitoxin system RelE/ParE family toxin n=1 Tax=Kribbella monticola TaxID=2185285 RepID=UPI000DD31AE9|nr:type II toxin-antitoxin system RelE/ParE family toxin [Kribbella monticola]
MAGKGKRSKQQPAQGAGDNQTPAMCYDDWVWWPNQDGRRCRAEEEFFALPPKVQGELADRIKRFLTGATRYKDLDDLGDGIRELRYREKNNHYRILFSVDGRVCVGLTCFYKNQRKTKKQDLDRARERMRSYRGP